MLGHNSMRLMARDRLTFILPLTADTHAAILDLQPIINTSDFFFRLVYQLTHRTLGCKDIAKNPAGLDSSHVAYVTLEAGSGVDITFHGLITYPSCGKFSQEQSCSGP